MRDIPKNDKIRESALTVIKGIGEAGFAMFTPGVGMALAAGLEILCIAANSFCDKFEDEKAKKVYIENYRSILLESAAIKTMNQADKETYANMADKVFLNLYSKEKKSLKDEEIDSIVSDVIKNTFSNTSSNNQKIIEDTVMYAITYMSFTFGEKDLKSYVINENNKRKNEIADFRDNHSKLETRVCVLENKSENTFKSDSQTDNVNKIIKEYADHFLEPLYLHEDNENVNLKNLFVFPKVKRLFKNDDAEDLSSFISSSCKEFDLPIVLAGDAGSGKTTIVSWLAFLYLDSASGDKRKQIFGDKKLVIIKLRDVDKKIILDKGLTAAICEYLGIKNDKNLFSDKFVIVDGMDEISLTDSYVNFGDYFNELKEKAKKAYKLIITSRSSIITMDNVFDETGRETYISYRIEPFSYNEKEAWIKKYEKITCTEIIDEVKRHILSRDENSIFDYPQLMYMIAGEKPERGKWSVNNKWSIYHHIFNDVVLNKEYDDEKHPYYIYRNTARGVLENIAYEMYKNDSQSKVAKKQIDKLVSELNDPNLSDSRKLFNAFKKYGYGLGCYWKMDDDAEVEFYHNNIRDYFIAEYLFRRLNSVFEDIDNSNDSWLNDKKAIANSLFSILGTVPIRKEVAEFISQRAEFNDQNLSEEYKDSFTEFLKVHVPFISLNNDDMIVESSFTELMNELCFDFDIFSGFENGNGYSVVRSVSNFLNNVITIIHSVLHFYNKDKYIAVFAYDFSGRSEFVNSVYRYNSYGRYINLSRAYLPTIDLSRTYLNNANLSGAFLMSARLYGAEISNADLNHADLNGADLTEVSMDDVDLSFCDLSGTHLIRSTFDECDFTGVIWYDATMLDNIITSAYVRGDGTTTYWSEKELVNASRSEKQKIHYIPGDLLVNLLTDDEDLNDY